MGRGGGLRAEGGNEAARANLAAGVDREVLLNFENGEPAKKKKKLHCSASGKDSEGTHSCKLRGV